eukprot:2158408-Prymnesium_polylepis.1
MPASRTKPPHRPHAAAGAPLEPNGARGAAAAALTLLTLLALLLLSVAPASSDVKAGACCAGAQPASSSYTAWSDSEPPSLR